MEVQLYGDIFLLVNGGMDFFILWLTGVVANRKMTHRRHILASALMAACPLAGIMIPFLRIFYSPMGTVLVLAGGIWLGFRPRRIKEFLSLFVIAYMSSFTVGGCGMALFYLLGAPPVFGGNVVFRTRLFPVKLLLVLTAFFYTAVKLGHRLLMFRLSERKDYCTVTVRYREAEAVLTAFIDSGNGLKDPFSGFPVLIGAFAALQTFFTKKSREIFFSGSQSVSAMQEYLLGAEQSLSLRLIPYMSLGQDNGLLLVFRPDSICINYLGKEWSSKEVMIGIYIGTFHDGYDALASPALLALAEKTIAEGRAVYHE